ncbi:MAG TPA: hypothetical protein VH107_11540 [Lacipirellulaceae bacterium]|nr:hypothetical protein [Lacipirellulaceae bacterium]
MAPRTPRTDGLFAGRLRCIFRRYKKTTPATAQKAINKNPAAASTATPQAKVPDGPGLNILIRRTILTINDAMLSDNYSVLRDLSAPGFQVGNSQAALAKIFADLKNRNIDLAPILMFDPKLVRPPEIDRDGMLHLSGILPTQPEQVNFDMLFQNVSDHWRMFGIALNTSRSQASSSSARPGESKP